jgi:hypothetical protein
LSVFCVVLHIILLRTGINISIYRERERERERERSGQNGNRNRRRREDTFNLEPTTHILNVSYINLVIHVSYH